ncbi:hypothetical protein AB835_05740 [Candidatus Endobugula sertula]|uniref:Porin domain-containing protein n=1 Tax=Candidatus Endobugula sertula TaxID=62101 RepID=A0A1D2QR28_9GAMM|nr:hypothetical protein AB835_05740 [Candidatus Endobugula sertula]
MKKALLALAVAGAAVSAQADVKLSGHVQTSFGDIEEFGQTVDTATGAVSNTNEESFSVNNTATSQSRFRITSSKEAGGITYGTNIEVGLREGGGTNLRTRKNEVTMAGSFGKVSIGHGSESSDGAVESSFSSTWVTWDDLSNYEVGYADLSTTTNEFGIYEVIDGNRTNRIRYDSPKIAGVLTFSGDIQDDDDLVFAARAGNSNFAGALYHLARDADNADEFGGSIAIKSGIFVASYGFAERDAANTPGTAVAAGGAVSGADESEAEYSVFNIGIETATYGLTLDMQNIELDNNRADNVAGEVSTVGLNFTYKPTSGVTLFADIHRIEADTTSVNAQLAGVNGVSGNGATAGARITF